MHLSPQWLRLMSVLGRWLCCWCWLSIDAPIVEVQGLFLVLLCNTLCPFLFCNNLDGEERADYCALIVFLVSCGFWCSVVLAHDDVGWSLVCDCCITFFF